MSRILALLTSDPNRVRCAVHPLRQDLVATRETRLDGWGIGYYQDNEILLRKRPQSAREPMQLAPLVSELRTDALLLHVREATVGSWTMENTHPFRFGQWLFAHRGTLGAFTAIQSELLARIPAFLHPSLRGETDSEHAFHLFLSRLADHGRLEDPNVDSRFVAGVLARTLAELDSLAAQAGVSTPALGNFMVTNGRLLVATRRGLPMHYVKRVGIEACEVCAPSAEPVRGQQGVVGHPLLRYVAVASDLRASPHAQDWLPVPDGSVVTVRRNLDVELAPLAL